MRSKLSFLQHFDFLEISVKSLDFGKWLLGMASPERAPCRVIGLGEEANIGWCVTSGEGLGG